MVQAYNRAQSESRFKDLSKRIIGVMFFSTPHKGSAVASFASILGRALSGASLGAHTNAQLVKDLERNSPKLEQVSNTFLQNAHHLRVITFHELNKMEYMSSLVSHRYLPAISPLLHLLHYL